mmetsp:Transcript_12932/g.27296  ORF Transcript_12932/g.27296 Transcript_12932/m.27296 type:complete len:207 (-) Transcript_12932:1135-1755(-)
MEVYHTFDRHLTAFLDAVDCGVGGIVHVERCRVMMERCGERNGWAIYGAGDIEGEVEEVEGSWLAIAAQGAVQVCPSIKSWLPASHATAGTCAGGQFCSLLRTGLGCCSKACVRSSLNCARNQGCRKSCVALWRLRGFFSNMFRIISLPSSDTEDQRSSDMSGSATRIALHTSFSEWSCTFTQNGNRLLSSWYIITPAHQISALAS